jgi:hypothetical protein
VNPSLSASPKPSDTLTVAAILRLEWILRPQALPLGAVPRTEVINDVKQYLTATHSQLRLSSKGACQKPCSL